MQQSAAEDSASRHPPAPLGATRLRGPVSHVVAQFLSAAVLSAIAAVLSAAVSLSNSSSPLSIAAVLLAAAKESSLPLPPSCSPPPKAPNPMCLPHRPVFSQPWVAPAGSQPGPSFPTGFWSCFWIVLASIRDSKSLPKSTQNAPNMSLIFVFVFVLFLLQLLEVFWSFFQAPVPRFQSYLQCVREVRHFPPSQETYLN